jgi:hypothetical protein
MPGQSRRIQCVGVFPDRGSIGTAKHIDKHITGAFNQGADVLVILAAEGAKGIAALHCLTYLGENWHSR